MMGWGHMWRYDGNYWWLGMIGMALQLIFWIVLFVIGVRLFKNYSLRPPADGHTPGKDPLDILRERYARGEIDTEEYQLRRQNLLEQ